VFRREPFVVVAVPFPGQAGEGEHRAMRTERRDTALSITAVRAVQCSALEHSTKHKRDAVNDEGTV
jgi:hypothetical protein